MPGLGRTRWLDGSLKQNPISATKTGDHRFDTEVDDLSAAGRRESLGFSQRKLPQLLAQMRDNLDPARVPLMHAQTIAKQNHGVIDIMNTMIQPQAQVLPEPDRAPLEVAMVDLRKAVDAHQVWLDKTLVPQAKGDFRLGQKLYDEKLAFTLIPARRFGGVLRFAGPPGQGFGNLLRRLAHP